MPRTPARRLAALALAASLPLAALLGLDATELALAAEGPSWSVAPADTATATDRARFEYDLEPGEVLDDAFEIRNDGATALALQVYAADAFTTREGGIDLLPAGEPSTDAGSWIELGADQVTLQPGETATVPFRLTVPADARPGDHPAGIVSSVLSDTADATVQVDRRLGSRVYLRVAGDLEPAATVSDVAVDYSGVWNPLALGAVTVDYTLTNTGNTRVTAASAIEVTGPFGLAPAGSATEQQPEVLPGSSIAVTQRLDGVTALFWLTGSVRVDPVGVGIGGAPLDPVLQSFDLVAPPAVPLLVLLGVALAVVAVIAVRARRRASHPAPVPEAGPTP